MVIRPGRLMNAADKPGAKESERGMSRRLLLALFIAGVVAANVVDAAGDRRPQMRIGGWGRVVDPDGDCSVSIEGARVTIRVPETSHEFAAELDRWNAPRIVRTVRQDFVAQVKVCGD